MHVAMTSQTSRKEGHDKAPKRRRRVWGRGRRITRGSEMPLRCRAETRVDARPRARRERERMRTIFRRTEWQRKMVRENQTKILNGS